MQKIIRDVKVVFGKIDELPVVVGNFNSLTDAMISMQQMVGDNPGWQVGMGLKYVNGPYYYAVIERL